MLKAFRLIKRVGKFHDVTAGRNLPLDRLTLIYAENGRGKTTLSSILRSLGTADPLPVLQRRRLGESDEPEIVLETSGGNAIFKDGKWTGPGPKIAIFDDEFVARNVHAGMAVDANHRQQLHDLIIGAQGVSLNNALQQEINHNEEHIRALAKRGDLIPKRLRGDLAPDKFCDIQPVAGLDEEVTVADRALAAARDADALDRHASLPIVALPRFDVAQINGVLGRSLQDVQQASLQKVQRHIRSLGTGGETWVADGHTRHALLHDEKGEAICPYCAQPYAAASVAHHYDAYFSDEYRVLRQDIERIGKEVAAQHTGTAIAELERTARVQGEELIYWGRFISTQPVVLDTAAIVKAWSAASTPTLAVLRQKFAAPLDRYELSPEALAAIEGYHQVVERVEDSMAAVHRMNADIALVKEGAKTANPAVRERDVARLRLVAARYSPEGEEVAAKYNAERVAKAATEKRRDAARNALDDYRQRIFPKYEERINQYLRALHAGFRLASVSAVNSRQGSSATYQILLDEIDVPISLNPTMPADPSVKTTLSSGDRNALALAFFLTSLELEPDPTRVVLLDDPMTSLDEHRTLATVREVLELRHAAGQVIVLSHSKPFLFSIWQDTSANDPRRAMRIQRDSRDTSTLSEWDVSQDAITEHDRRSAMVQQYLDSPVGLDERRVAEALRPMLESFLRVAYPEWFPPGALLGQFINKATTVLGTPNAKLSAADTAELTALTRYANLFHHDTNASFRTQVIHDAELRDQAKRVIAFTRRG